MYASTFCKKKIISIIIQSTRIISVTCQCCRNTNKEIFFFQFEISNYKPARTYQSVQHLEKIEIIFVQKVDL